jgi:hypothetical protein
MTFAKIAPEYVRPMIGLTAVKLFGFDIEKLTSLASRIGPSVEDIAKGRVSLPGPDYVGYGFREHASWPATAYRGLSTNANVAS